ncbi:heptosyltransferase-1 [Granulicella aggregans]|uniref:Heptosyltransferase-1 n=2 Tax=Granulicella aggregans TaxID=474949 RepID=A0A7W7Z9Q9_9BACT|nr:heptosyltransferase-1 [Granulicella aggregans]
MSASSTPTTAAHASATTPLRVLIVRTSAMGDVLHALPAVAAMRQQHPDWYIGWVIDPRWRPLLQAEGGEHVATGDPKRPIVDRCHTVPTQEWKRKPLTTATVSGIAALGKELRAAKYDLCVDMQGLIRSSLVGRMSGTPRYTGRSRPRESAARWLYKSRVVTHSAHVIDQGCELLGEAICSPLTACEVRLPVDSEAEAWVDDFLDRTLPKELWNRYALFAPTAGWGAKQWPHERYGRVAIALAEAGYATLVNAYKADDAAALAVVKASLGCAVAAPATMPQMIALQRRAAIVIAGDTGPLHLAAALGRPVVGLYGPTDPDRTGPYSTKRRVLRHCSSVVDHSRHDQSEAGLQRITVEEVIAAALDLLRESEMAQMELPQTESKERN